MPEFRYDANGLKEIRKRAIMRHVLIFLAIAGWVASEFYRTPVLLDASMTQLWPILIPPLFVGVFSVITITRGMKRARSIIESYELVLEDDSILRMQDGVEPFRAQKADVTSIKVLSFGNIKVHTKHNHLTIPKHVGPKEELLAALSELGPIEHKQGTLIERYPALLSLLSIGLTIGCLAASEPWLVLATGLPLLALMAWAFIVVRTDANVHERLKRSSWLTLLMMVVVAGKIMQVLGLEVLGLF